MIKAGNHTVSDKGFTVVTENIGGVPRQAVVAELPGGISDEALAAFCAGPIEVLAEDGSTTATYTGPFRVVSHGLKLTRTSEDSDELDRLQVNWRDHARPSQAALSDAIVKQVTAMPWLANSDVILEKLGYTDSDITRLLVDKRKAETRSVLDSLVNGGNKDDGQPATGPAASQPSQSGGTGAPRSGETVGDAATAQS